ncbi:MAG: 23S rRNA (guanosine(2251)-2'-O)-methyltransferase RlmB [Sulfurospirillum sp.]|nr:MAG: 23S rRNA (guanosine(2251)-2'-O)-methyltransferase RlmB [Sulfurospirillum sp.]
MIIYGKQVFLYILEKYPSLVEEVYLAKEVDKKLFSKITGLGKPVVRLDTKKAQAMARGGNHQGMFLKISEIGFASFHDVKKGDFVVVLQGITDVGNIGAIIRSAYALGADAIIVSGVKTVPMEALVRTSSGAIFDMPVVLFHDTATLINELKQAGFTTYAATMDGEDVRNMTFPEKKALVMGSEGEGLPARIVQKCDRKIAIKMEREFDSLNVSVATAILCDRMR